MLEPRDYYMSFPHQELLLQAPIDVNLIHPSFGERRLLARATVIIGPFMIHDFLVIQNPGEPVRVEAPTDHSVDHWRPTVSIAGPLSSMIERAILRALGDYLAG